MTGRSTHGHTKGRRISPSMMSWLAMRNRCTNPKNEKYPMYGGKGVRVCERWSLSLEAFLEDMGERPAGKTIDRWPDGKGNYEPGNCRWATPKEQGENSDNAGKGWKRKRTHCPDGHAFVAVNTHIRPDGSRRCRACTRQKARARRERGVGNGERAQP